MTAHLRRHESRLAGAIARTALVVLGASAILAGTVPAQASGSAHRSEQKGPGAAAIWSTFPRKGGPVPGVVYTDTSISASRDAILADGTKINNNFVFVDEFSYTFNEVGDFIPLTDTFGDAEGSAVSFSAANKLAAASVTAMVQLTACSKTGCTTAGRASVSVDWTADGPRALVNGTFVFHTKGLTEVSKQHGFFRDARATAQVSNLPTVGRLRYGDIFNESFRDTCIGTGC